MSEDSLVTTKLAASSAKSSFADFVQSARQSVMLVDCSSSMASMLASGGRTIDAARQVVAALREVNPVPVIAFYSHTVEEVDRIPEPCGGTPMHDAIDFARVNGATHIVLVTDAGPNSQAATLAAAKVFEHVIDVFYIGDGNDEGAKFAARLAAQNGGTCNLSRTDLGTAGGQKKLVAKIAGMLGDGSGI